jgi:flagellar biosynthetic protein FliO
LLGLVGFLTLGFLFILPANSAGPVQDPFANSTGLAMDVFFKLIVVVGLIFLASVVLRRMKGGKGFRNTRQMALKESINLTPKRALHLVEIDGRKFMLGSTDQSINLIAELTGSESKVISENPMLTPADEFQTLLSNSIKQKALE